MPSADSVPTWMDIKEWALFALTTGIGVVLGIIKKRDNDLEKLRRKELDDLKETDRNIQLQIDASVEHREGQIERLTRVEEGLTAVKEAQEKSAQAAAIAQGRIEKAIDDLGTKLYDAVKERNRS